MATISNLPIPPNPVSTPLDQFWPILCKGQANRLIFPGPPLLEQEWHAALEQGRLKEGSINDAMFAIQKEKADIQRAIQHYLDLNQVATDAQFPHSIRKFKLAADVLTFLQRIHLFMQDIQGLTQAIQTNLQVFQLIEAQALAMIQNNINALANFMQQICNLGLPPLPSLPAFFGANIFSFNGFNFAALIPRPISFAAFSNFSFSQCTLAIPNLNVYSQPPAMINFDGYTVGATTGTLIPPLNGQIGDPSQLTNPSYVAQLQGQLVTPVYNPNTVNPATILQGSLPNPTFIISNYQMPSATYKSNILSTVPVFDSLIANQPANANQERTLLVENVNISGIVASNYDKNLTAAWLYYLEAARSGRAGTWLPNFVEVYNTYIQPSLTLLESPSTTIPWNTVLGGTGTTAAPTDVPLVDTLQKASANLRQNILWKLSYIEASLLGYTRTLQFDNGADPIFLSSFTGADLDYGTTTLSLTDTVTIILGADTADFPVQCTVPKAMLNVLNEVIILATSNIAGAATYATNRPQFRFTYDAFAQATQVDRFTQFWRTFNYNMQQLLAQDPYIISLAVSYAASLDAAVDPLGSPEDYQQIENDALTRIRTWQPGQPLLTLPIPPTVTIGPLPGISGTTNGWSNSSFDPQSFLDRPDVQALPLSTQLTMLRTNESYASLMTASSDIQTAVSTAQAQAQAALASVQNNGFSVSSTTPLLVRNSISPLPINFDTTNYDNTNYVTSPTLFTIQVAGKYMVGGTVNWDMGPAGVRTAILIQNSTIVLDEEQTDALTVGPVTQNFSIVQDFNAGDTLQVLVSQNTGIDTYILPAAELSVILVPSMDAIPDSTDTNIQQPDTDNQARFLPADVTMVAGVAVEIQSDGGVSPIDPVGAVTSPLVDGVVLNAVELGQPATVGTSYGTLYTVSGATFSTGGLIYAGPGGILTQDYNTLITEVNWIVVIGRAIGADMFLFEPQIPTKIIGF